MKEKFTRTNIQAVLTTAGIDTERARKLTTGIIEALTVALATGKAVELRGLGSLEVKERKAYKARNPKTGEAVNVQPRRRVIFHSGRGLKKALNRKEE